LQAKYSAAVFLQSSQVAVNWSAQAHNRTIKRTVTHFMLKQFKYIDLLLRLRFGYSVDQICAIELQSLTDGINADFPK